jgi:hypothetical protein
MSCVVVGAVRCIGEKPHSCSTYPNLCLCCAGAAVPQVVAANLDGGAMFAGPSVKPIGGNIMALILGFACADACAAVL